MHILQSVNCPPDRGDAPYSGRIVSIGDTIETNIHGVRYRWITVQRNDTRTQHVWPSHRLGFKL